MQSIIVRPGNPALFLHSMSGQTVSDIRVTAPEYVGDNWNASAFQIRRSCYDITVHHFEVFGLQRGGLFQLPAGSTVSNVKLVKGVFDTMFTKGAGRHAAGLFVQGDFHEGPDGRRVPDATYQNCLVDRVAFYHTGWFDDNWNAYNSDPYVYATHNDHGWYCRDYSGGWDCTNSLFYGNAFNGGTWRGGRLSNNVFLDNYHAGSLKYGTRADHNVIFINSVRGCGHDVHHNRRNLGSTPPQLDNDSYPLNGVLPEDRPLNLTFDIARRSDWPTNMQGFNPHEWAADAMSHGASWSYYNPTQEVIDMAFGPSVPAPPPVVIPPPVNDLSNYYTKDETLNLVLGTIHEHEGNNDHLDHATVRSEALGVCRCPIGRDDTPPTESLP